MVVALRTTGNVVSHISGYLWPEQLCHHLIYGLVPPEVILPANTRTHVYHVNTPLFFLLVHNALHVVICEIKTAQLMLQFTYSHVTK